MKVASSLARASPWCSRNNNLPIAADVAATAAASRRVERTLMPTILASLSLSPTFPPPDQSLLACRRRRTTWKEGTGMTRTKCSGCGGVCLAVLLILGMIWSMLYSNIVYACLP